MKFILAFFTFALIILVECDSITADDSSEEANEGPSYFPGFPRKCRKDEDCRKDECCQGLLVFGGTCKDRAREGEWCLEGTGYGRFVHGCPCREGLECREFGWRNNKYPGYFPGRPTCIRPPTTVTDEVTTVTDKDVGVTDEVTNDVTEVTEETATDNRDKVTSEGDNLVTSDFTEETPEFETVSSESDD